MFRLQTASFLPTVITTIPHILIRKHLISLSVFDHARWSQTWTKIWQHLLCLRPKTETWIQVPEDRSSSTISESTVNKFSFTAPFGIVIFFLKNWTGLTYRSQNHHTWTKHLLIYECCLQSLIIHVLEYVQEMLCHRNDITTT